MYLQNRIDYCIVIKYTSVLAQKKRGQEGTAISRIGTPNLDNLIKRLKSTKLVSALKYQAKLIPTAR